MIGLTISLKAFIFTVAEHKKRHTKEKRSVVASASDFDLQSSAIQS